MAGRFSVDAVFRALDHFTRPVRGMQRSLGRFTTAARTGLRGVGRMAVGVAEKFATVAKYAGLAAAAAAAFATRDVIKSGMEYEQAITDVGAVMLLTRDQIGLLDEKAKQLGATTKFTATESANAMELMARAGFQQQEILAGVGGVLSAAAASGLELAEVADHVSNVLKGMGLEATEATRVADVLALASSRTNSTIGSLGESMRNVASTARQLGVPLEDAVAAVAALQDVGLDASVAGSALNTMLTKLAKPPAAVAAQMKKMGVTFRDAKGNMLPLREVMANLAKAAKESGGNMEQVAFFADLVGLRGQKAATNLKDLLLSGKFDELAGALRNAGGAAKEMADIKLDTFTGKWELLKSKVKGFEIALYEAGQGPLRDLLSGLDEWIDRNQYAFLADAPVWIADLRDLFSEFSEGFSEGFDPLLEGFKGFWDAISGQDGSAQFTKDMFKNLGVLAGALAGALLVLGSVLAGITYGIGALLMSIKYVGEALGDFVYWLVNDLPHAFEQAWSEAGSLPGKMISALMMGFGGQWGALVNAVTGLIGDFWASVKKSLGVSSHSTIARDLAGNVIGGFVDGLQSGWQAIKDAASKFGRVLWAAIKHALGIASPSKPGIAIGENIGDSVANAITSKRDLVRRSWADLTKSLSGTADIAVRVKRPDAITIPRRDVMIEPVRPFIANVDRQRPRMFKSPAIDSALRGFRGRDQGAEPDSAQRRRDVGKLITPAERMSRSVTETLRTERTEAEITIRDESGKASITKAPKGRGVGLRMQPSGSF